MSQYLIVTHKTAFAPELRDKVGELAAADPAAEFAILVPEAPGENYTWEGETVSPAQQNAEALKQDSRKDVSERRSTASRSGVEDPLQAIADELRASRAYDTLVILHVAARCVPVAQAGSGAPGRAEVRAARHPHGGHAGPVTRRAAARLAPRR